MSSEEDEEHLMKENEIFSCDSWSNDVQQLKEPKLGQIQAKKLKKANWGLLVEILKDINTGISSSMVSIIITINVIIQFNQNIGQYNHISWITIILTVISGYFMSFCFNGGNYLLKGFSATQSILLYSIVKNYGIHA